jgi:hypothetical protein
MKAQFILPLFFLLSQFAENNSAAAVTGQTESTPDTNWVKGYQQTISYPYPFLSAAAEESLYIGVIHSNKPKEYLNFLALYPESYFAVLAAARYLLLELQRGSQLQILINNLNEIGFSAYLVSLHPLITNKQEHLKRAVVFPDHKLRMILRENYSGQLKEDPQVEWYLDFDKFIEMPFDALHLAARRHYFRIQDDYIQYLIADSLGLQQVQKAFHRLNYIMDDLSKHLGYTSTADLFSQVLDREFLMYGKLTVFAYSADEFQILYCLKKAGWSYPLNGLIFIDPQKFDEQEFLEYLIHQISHIFIAGNIHNIHHSACRWFDEGFAQWAGRCYSKYQTLLPAENSFQQRLLQEDIRHLQSAAREIWLSRKKKKIKFSSLNKQISNYKNLSVQEQAKKLSLSLIAYLVETFGSEKLLQVASRVSHVGQNYSERSMYYILGWAYSDIQKGWNEWLQQAPATETNTIEAAGEVE